MDTNASCCQKQARVGPLACMVMEGGANRQPTRQLIHLTWALEGKVIQNSKWVSLTFHALWMMAASFLIKGPPSSRSIGF